MRMKTIWIFAGESSGDLYGAHLAAELKRQRPDVVLRGMGSNAMRAAGVDLIVDSSELGIVGFVEVLKHLRMFLRLFDSLVERAAAERPDAVVLIDYPGFNLRFARQMRRRGIPVVYYISPQVWAWGKRRIPQIARDVTRMLVIFPFEPQVYAGTGLDVRFVGHPLRQILAARRDPALAREPDTVLLLPGSRNSELDRLLAPFVETAAWLKVRNPRLKFVLAAPNERIAELVTARLRSLNTPPDSVYLL
jgi:lipid-A-disaccharide synthase